MPRRLKQVDAPKDASASRYRLRIFRLNYVDSFERLFDKNKETVSEFHQGWLIDLAADGGKLGQTSNKHGCKRIEELKRGKRMSWSDFLTRAKKVDEQFLEVHDLAVEAWQGDQR